MKDKKGMIVGFLEQNGRNSTSKIAKEIKANIIHARIYLGQLEEEGKIIKDEETRAIYWRIKNG